MERSANGSMPVSLQKLSWAVESAHGCATKYAGKVTIHEKRNGSTVWYGCVHIFELIGHPSAKWAYAWSVDAFIGHETQILTALHHGPICSPEDAVRATLAESEEDDESV
jgi:hypothetical protein